MAKYSGPNNVNGNGSGEAVPLPKLPFQTLLESPNLAKEMSQEYLDCLGQKVVEGYQADCASRKQWMQKTAEAQKLALQVVEQKSFPWPNCSNVKFPLVTIAALQFLSRMAILTKGRQIAKCDALGLDPDGSEGKRADRIASHLSYQLIEEEESWLDDDEKAKFSASIVGCAFKKTFFDPVGGVNQSIHVPAARLVVDYWTRDLDKSNRVTHEVDMTANDLAERVRRGVFLECDHTRTPNFDRNELDEVRDQIQGMTAPDEGDSVAPYLILEQHCWIDFDGDGYQEPYIVSVKADTSEVLRIVARFYGSGDVIRQNDSLIRKLESDMEDPNITPESKARYEAQIKKLRDDPENHILRIVPLQAFTKIPFIPSPDGGFYDLGLGALLGPMNASVDTIVNQLIDSGTMQNTAGGFLGRGVKMKGGSTGFAPFEWKPVDSNGDDLRKNIVPLPVQAPSTVLFQLLGMLVSYSERISGSTDIMSGVSPGQNTPAETSRNTIEQGMKIFSGIYGRMHRGFRRELQKYVALNRLFLEDNAEFYNLVTGEGAMIARDDYIKGRFSVRPAADPASASETQRQQKAMMLAERARGVPGYNVYEVEKNLLEAFDVPNISTIYPDPEGPNAIPPGSDPKIDLEHAKLAQAAQFKQLDAQIAIANLQIESSKVAAQITNLEASSLKLAAEAQGVDVGHQIAVISAQIGAAKTHQDGIIQTLQLLQQAAKLRHEMKSSSSEESAPKGPSQPKE